jgi:hypothetical protein
MVTWLQHHLALGIERFFIRLEDSPELQALLASPPWSQHVELDMATSTTHDYFDIIQRQQQMVAAAIPRARACGLTHLLHIDDDELLLCAHGPKALAAELSRLVACEGVADVHLSNVEALPPHLGPRHNLFEGVTCFRHEPRHYCAYSNGKSFGQLSAAGLRPKGAHRFRGDSPEADSSVSLSPAVACILHFEATTFELWKAKFTAMGKQHAEGRVECEPATAGAVPKVPFAYYRDSIAMCRYLESEATEGAASLHEAVERAQTLWRKWKQAPGSLPDPPLGRGPPLVLDSGVTLVDPLGWSRAS